MFNPYFREGNLLLNDIRFDASATWPLYGRIAEVRKGRYGMSSVGTLRGCDTIKFVTGPQAEAVPGSLESRKLRPDEARWMYLVIENKGGESQKELADLLLSSLDRQLYGPRLSYSGNSMSEVLVRLLRPAHRTVGACPQPPQPLPDDVRKLPQDSVLDDAGAEPEVLQRLLPRHVEQEALTVAQHHEEEQWHGPTRRRRSSSAGRR